MVSKAESCTLSFFFKKKKQKAELLPELLEVKQAHTQRGKMYQKLEHQLDKNITFSTFKTSSTLQQGIKEMPIPYNKMLQIPEEIHFGYCNIKSHIYLLLITKSYIPCWGTKPFIFLLKCWNDFILGGLLKMKTKKCLSITEWWATFTPCRLPVNAQYYLFLWTSSFWEESLAYGPNFLEEH